MCVCVCARGCVRVEFSLNIWRLCIISQVFSDVARWQKGSVLCGAIVRQLLEVLVEVNLGKE